MPLFGSVKPTASNSLNSPFARPKPTNSPVTDASRPTVNASISTALSTWRRLAPRVRRMANSRVRWAIVIDSELAITKLPTNSAMPANASRNVLKNDRNELVASADFCACSAPVRTWVPGGRIVLISFTSFWGDTPARAEARMSSSLPCLSNSRWAVGSVKPGQRRAAERARRAEVHEPGHLHLLHRPLGLHPDRVAHVDVLLAGRAGVDHHLVRQRATSPA